MSDQRAKFRELMGVFDPIYRPHEGAGDGPGRSFVPEAHQDYRSQLEAALDLNDNAKLLVAGQPGCGKTTLLLGVAQKLRGEGRIVAFVDLEAQTAVQDLGTVEMYLAATAELLSEAQAATAPVSAPTLDACRGWLARVRDGDEVAPNPHDIATALRRHLSAVRESRALRDELRALLRQGGDDPLRLLSRVLDDLAQRRPVVLLDGLDKLPPGQALEVFLNEKRKPMAEAPGAAVLTIPLSVVYEPTFNVLSERYNNADSAVLPAVRLYEFDPAKRTRVPSEKGALILRRIVEARVDPIDPNVVMPETIDRAIAGSGGNIRELARLMQASVVKAYVRRGGFIEPQDVEAAIADQRESFRRAYDPRFLPVLKRVRDEYQLNESDEVVKQLLYGLWVIEYRNGIAWYSLPTPVEQLLRQLERA
ncbi:MAG TPA: ATP-binding protein [Polyangiaceae bacterium]|nr:ATP-binding protein [Polyangiaceae bacterium]